MPLRLKFLFKCKRSHKYLKKKPLFTGKEETHSLITQRRSRGVQRDSARTHTRKQRERYTMRRSTRAHRSSSGKEEGKEKRNLESPFPIRKRSDDTSEFEDDFVEKKTTTKKTKRMGGHSVAANEEAKIKTRSSKQKKEIVVVLERGGTETAATTTTTTDDGDDVSPQNEEEKKKSTKTTEEKEKKLRILLVEDDIPTSLIITSMLTQAGAIVTNASNGKQALERLRDNNYHEKIDLILTDIMMPEVDGIELCSILSKNPKLKEVPIIVMSVSDHLEATGEVLDESKAHAIGAEGFLQKPLSKDVCRSMVGTHHRLPSNGSSSSSSLLLTTTTRNGDGKNDNNNNNNNNKDNNKDSNNDNNIIIINNSGSEEKGSGGSDDPSTFKLAVKESGGLGVLDEEGTKEMEEMKKSKTADRWTRNQMRDADCGSDEGSGAGGGRESSGNEEEGEEEKKKKEDSSEKETMKTTTTTTVTARELATAPMQEEGPGTSARRTSDLVTNILHSEQKKLFSGLSVQLVRAHGGPTAVLELALPPHSHNKGEGSNNDGNEYTNDSDRVKLRRSESRSAFQSFIKQNENKNVGVETVALPIDPMSMVFPNLNDGAKADMTPDGKKKSGKNATKAARSRLSKKSTSPQAAMTEAKDVEAAELLVQYQMQQQQQQEQEQQEQEQQEQEQQQQQQQQQYQMQMQQQQFMQMQMQFHLQQQNFMGAAQDPATVQANAQAYQNLMQSLAMSQQQQQQHQMQMPPGFNPAAAAAAAMFASSLNGAPPPTSIHSNAGMGMFPYFQQNQEYVNSFVQALASAVEKAPMTMLEHQHQQHHYAPQQPAQPFVNTSAAQVKLDNIVANNTNAAVNNVNTASTCAERRALAIARFLKKRKERKFEKKVRYASRKRLAEARPRVRGQFVKKVVAVEEVPTTIAAKIATTTTTNSDEEANKASEETLKMKVVDE